MRKNVRHKIIVFLTVFLLLTAIFSPVAGAIYAYGESYSYSRDELLSYAKGIVAWRNQTAGLPADADVIKDVLTSQAGTTSSDWFVIAMSKLGLPGDYNAYLAGITEQVKQRYQSEGKLSSVKATEWHRISLAMLACGGNPQSVGGSINLIADGTYNRGLVKPLNAQGNNGIVFALISLDAKNYGVPANALESRMDILQSLLDCQLADGGFAQWGSSSDVDVTAMALTALAPYKNSYSSQIGKAVSFLSSKQSTGGGFSSGGVENAESTAQVIIALTSLGINPQTDLRFIKNGNSAVNNLISYAKESGGICHTAGGVENEMASQQAMCAIAALVRQMDGQSGIYRFTTAMPSLSVAETEIEAEEVPGEISQPSAENTDEEEGKSALNNESGDYPETNNSIGEEDSRKEVYASASSETETKDKSTVFLSYILLAAAFLFVFLGFKFAKGRKKDTLILFGVILALIAFYILSNPQTVDRHYAATAKDDVSGSVLISINCSTVFENWDALDESLRSGGYLPKDGVILKESKYPIEEGDTVFDVLLDSVTQNKIQFDYQGGDANIYDTIYIRGIQYLYEFSCGPLSGWTYAVNGDFPDIGCSSYTLSDGDRVEWFYTCDLGRDVGDLFEGESD